MVSLGFINEDNAPTHMNAKPGAQKTSENGFKYM